MKLEPLMQLHATLRQGDQVGATPLGQRMIAEVTGGTFEGERLKGTIVTPGADWILVSGDGIGMIDVRATLKTDDGAFIYTQYKGRLLINEAVSAGQDTEFGDTYFFTQPLYETGHPDYLWINSIVAVAEGRITGDGVAYQVYECRH